MDASTSTISTAMLMTTSLPPAALMSEMSRQTSTDSSRSGEDNRRRISNTSDSDRQEDDLDRLGSRLEKFVNSRRRRSTSPAQPSPRKNSTGSHIPKPEISPKPAFLVAAVANRGANTMSQSVRSHPKYTKDSEDKSIQHVTAANGSKTLGTASMLKSTLRRMTRLSVTTTSKVSSEHPSSQKTSPTSSEGSANNQYYKRVSPGGRRHVSPGPSVSRTKSFRDPQDGVKMSVRSSNPAIMGSQRNCSTSSSLRRSMRQKDFESTSRPGFQRSGTGSTLERRSVSRSHSIASGNRRFRDKDLNVRKSRAVQTQLTRDVLHDEDLADNGEELAKSLDFNLYLPELLGVDVDAVETHVSEPTEPVDVRKNRQLTLDNMKLHREVEKLKSQVCENDMLKKELRAVKSRLEEEQRSRGRIEQELDKHNKKVQMIVQSMDCVEREFENRDENIHSLETRLDEYKRLVSSLQAELDASSDVIANLQRDLEKSRAAQKILSQQYYEAEAESRELHEFLQAEKMTLAETLKDCESEIATLTAKLVEKDVDIANVEDRCSHLVRLGEQRHQEILALEAQLTGFQDKARDMLLAQGAEISRANIHISELYSKLEKLLEENGTGAYSIDGGNLDPVSSSAQSEDLIPTSEASFPRSNSQFLIPTPHISTSETSFSINSNGSNSELMAESLSNLSKAIMHRQRSENPEESMTSSNGSMPSLAERISDVQALVDKVVNHIGRTSASNGIDTNHSANKIPSEEIPGKENLSTNGVNGHKEEELKTNENEINELKSKFLKHRQILVHNYEQAETEIRRLDEIFHETVEQVLQTFSTVPEVIQSHPQLHQLQKSLEITYSDGGKGIQKEIFHAALKADNVNANQSL